MILRYLLSILALASAPVYAQWHGLKIIETRPISILHDTTSLDFIIYKGYVQNLQDTITIVVDGNASDAFSAHPGDSITYHLNCTEPVTDSTLMAIQKQVQWPNLQRAFVQCVFTFKEDEISIESCLCRWGAIFYKNGKPVFSMDKKENRQLKKQHQKNRIPYICP